MASSKSQVSGGRIPESFVSPFKRVQMEERNDDALACIATLTGKTLADVTKIAIELGYPPFGPAYVDDALITRILGRFGLAGGEYQEVPSIEALPDVAILLVDYDESIAVGRHLVWHHVRANGEQKSFSYILDVGSWLDPKHHMTTDFKHLKLSPAWFIPVTPKAPTRGK